MHVALHLKQSFDLRGVFGTERIEHPLVRAGGMHPALDAVARDQLDEAEPGRDHADRTHDGVLVGEDLVAGASEPVPARRRDILGEGEHGDAALVGPRAYAPGDQGALDRRAARRIDRKCHRGEPLGRERAVDRPFHVRQREVSGADRPDLPDYAGEPQHRDHRRRLPAPPGEDPTAARRRASSGFLATGSAPFMDL